VKNCIGNLSRAAFAKCPEQNWTQDSCSLSWQRVSSFPFHTCAECLIKIALNVRLAYTFLTKFSSQVLDALDEIAFNAEFDSFRISKERKAVQAEAQVGKDWDGKAAHMQLSKVVVSVPDTIELCAAKHCVTTMKPRIIIGMQIVSLTAFVTWLCKTVLAVVRLENDLRMRCAPSCLDKLKTRAVLVVNPSVYFRLSVECACTQVSGI
jgi:hypothetical protein